VGRCAAAVPGGRVKGIKINILKESFNFLGSTNFKFLISGFRHEITIRCCVKPQEFADAKF
jgi:hypothetical protein